MGLNPTHGEGKRPIDPLAGAFVGERKAPFTEPHRFAALAVGPLVEKSWRGGGEPADFFALKGVLEALAAHLRVELSFAPAEEPFLHPGRCAAVAIEGAPAGWIGEVHPLVCRDWDLEGAVGFEIEAGALIGAAAAGEELFGEISTFPTVRKDLAIVVPVGVAAAEVRGRILAAGEDLLHTAEAFDLFEGEQLGAGLKSLAFGLEFCASDRTLTDEDVVGLIGAITDSLKEIGGTLRE
jgi:phenylalanyl-tRNA synthetase beta chain